MLVLSRRKNESLLIGGNIELLVVDVRGDKVRLGIDAPSDIPILRKEIIPAVEPSPAPLPADRQKLPPKRSNFFVSCFDISRDSAKFDAGKWHKRH